MRISILMILFLTMTIAHAEWNRVAESPTHTLHADAATIQKEGEGVKMWDLADFKVLQSRPYGAPYLSQKTQREYDCKGARVHTLEQVNFPENMAGGEASPLDVAGDWEAVAAGSTLDALLKVACAGR